MFPFCGIVMTMTTAGYCLTEFHAQRWQKLITPLKQQPFAVTGYVANVAPLAARPYMASVHIVIQSLTQEGNSNCYDGMHLVNYMPIKSAPPVGSDVSIAEIKPQQTRITEDISLFLRKNNIIHQLFNRTDFATCTYTNSPSPSILQKPQQYGVAWRNRFYRRCTEGLSPLSKLYVGLIFFGNKEPGCDDVRMRFGHWGLAHFLARSGLHIVIFVLLITLLLRMVPIHSNAKHLLLFAVCLLYDALSWSSISFLRAWLLALLLIARHFIGRHTMYVHLLCLSAIGILAYNPCYLMAVDFQLTYALTFALTLFSGLLKTNTSAIQDRKNLIS
jgi:competence protein ComEC